MNYVDANILIYATSDETERGAAARKLLETEDLITNLLSLDEVAYILRKKSTNLAIKGIDVVSKTPNLKLVPFLYEDIAAFKALLEKGLKPRDAIHALTAVKMNCQIIYSEDPDFDKISELKRKTPW